LRRWGCPHQPCGLLDLGLWGPSPVIVGLPHMITAASNHETMPPHMETEEQRHKRFARGDITEAEIKHYWKNPDKPLFRHEIHNITAGNGENLKSSRKKVEG
jgi:hypothetical protein